MNIYSHLHTEHEEIIELMNGIANCENEDDPQKFILFDDFKRLLLTHAKAEEEAFYNRLKDFSMLKDKIRLAKREHKDAENLLNDLSDKNLVGAAWQKVFMKLKADVEHHIQEEEGEVFSLAKSFLGAKNEDLIECDMEAKEKEIEIP